MEPEGQNVWTALRCAGRRSGNFLNPTMDCAAGAFIRARLAARPRTMASPVAASASRRVHIEFCEVKITNYYYLTYMLKTLMYNILSMLLASIIFVGLDWRSFLLSEQQVP